jgi:alpha-1,2-mannosyltransferase
MALRRRFTPIQLMAVTIVALALVSRRSTKPWTFIDLVVYRGGAEQLLHQHSIYAGPAGRNAFTYPPFAAAAFIPLQVLGEHPANVVMTLLSLVALAVSVLLLGRHLHLQRWVAVVVVGLGGLALQPVQYTLWLGQVNLVLMAFVLLDIFVMPRRFKGMLIGVAAGIKLVPGIFVLYYLLRRDWASALKAVLWFLLTVTAGLALAPADSARYWAHLFFDASRIGDVVFGDNQSIYGLLARLFHTAHPSRALYLALALTALGMAVLAARRQLDQGSDLGAVTCIAIGGLLASPVSWSHHWVWVLPVLVLWLVRRESILAMLGAVTVFVAPMYFTPLQDGREFGHTWWQALACASYVLLGLVFLVSMVISRPAPDFGPATEPALATDQAP